MTSTAFTLPNPPAPDVGPAPQPRAQHAGTRSKLKRDATRATGVVAAGQLRAEPERGNGVYVPQLGGMALRAARRNARFRAAMALRLRRTLGFS